MSARERVPLTGRSNLSARNSSAGELSGRMSAYQSAREQEQAPVSSARPGAPLSTTLTILPQSRHKTVPPEDPTLSKPHRNKGRHAAPLCPDGWIKANMTPNWFDQSRDPSSGPMEIETKTKLVRDFVESHRRDLWKYDRSFANRSPREIADELIDNPGLRQMFKKFHGIERKMKLSNSDRTKASLRDDHLNSLGEVQHDPFLQSHSTPRDARINKMTYLLQTASLGETVSPFKRGYKHATEYGNFSNFNSILAANKNAMLNR